MFKVNYEKQELRIIVASRQVIFALRILERQTLVNLVHRELCLRRTTYVLLGQESMTKEIIERRLKVNWNLGATGRR